MNETSRATVVIVDNSPVTIDGDFFPNRLDAQKQTIEKLAENYAKVNPTSQIGIITMSPPEMGIRSSLTPNPQNTISSLKTIQRGNKEINIELGIKSAIMALKHPFSPINSKRILLFIASKVQNIKPETCEWLNRLMDANNITIDILVLGNDNDDNKIQTLRLINRSQEKVATFLHLLSCPPHQQIYNFVFAIGNSLVKDQVNSKPDHQTMLALMQTAGCNEIPYWLDNSFRAVMQPLQTQKKRGRKTDTKVLLNVPVISDSCIIDDPELQQGESDVRSVNLNVSKSKSTKTQTKKQQPKKRGRKAKLNLKDEDDN